MSFTIGDSVVMCSPSDRFGGYRLKAGPYQGVEAAKAAHSPSGIWCSELPGFDSQSVFWFAQNERADWLRVIVSEDDLELRD